MAKTILVVDDEKNIVEVLKLRLEASGYKVDAAYDGEEGLAKARNGKYDLILLDLTLPKRDGQSVCLELKMDSKVSKIPIVMLTARAQAKEKEIGQKMGADAYITKPFDPKELLSTIQRLTK